MRLKIFKCPSDTVDEQTIEGVLLTTHIANGYIIGLHPEAAGDPAFADALGRTNYTGVAGAAGNADTANYYSRWEGVLCNRSNVTLGQLLPEDGPSRKVVDPVYLGGPLSTQVLFALVERKQSPSGQSLELMPGLYVAVDEETVDRIMRTESDHARFVAGLVVWQRGELRAEIERGAWYVLPPDAHLALQKPSPDQWEDLVRLAQQRANSI